MRLRRQHDLCGTSGDVVVKAPEPAVVVALSALAERSDVSVGHRPDCGVPQHSGINEGRGYPTNASVPRADFSFGSDDDWSRSSDRRPGWATEQQRSDRLAGCRDSSISGASSVTAPAGWPPRLVAHAS